MLTFGIEHKSLADEHGFGTPRATSTRDLADLVSLGVPTVTGTLKSTRYHLNFADSGERSA